MEAIDQITNTGLKDTLIGFGVLMLIVRMLVTDIMKWTGKDKPHPFQYDLDKAHRKIDSTAKRVTSVEISLSKQDVRLEDVERHRDKVAEKLDDLRNLVAQLNTSIQVLSSRFDDKGQ